MKIRNQNTEKPTKWEQKVPKIHSIVVQIHYKILNFWKIEGECRNIPKLEDKQPKILDVEKSSKVGTKTAENHDICASNLITNPLENGAQIPQYIPRWEPSPPKCPKCLV